MSRSRRFVNMLAAGWIAIAICTTIGLSLPAVTPARARADASHTTYLPIAKRSPMPLGILTTPAELAATKTQADRGIQPSADAVKSLLKNADEMLTITPCAVSIYTSSTGADCLNQAAEATYVLALAFRITGDARYSEQAAACVRAWSGTLVTIEPSDSQAQLDWSRFVPAMIWGADLLESAPGWTSADRQSFVGMLMRSALLQGQLAAVRTNNWADAGNLLRLSIAVYADLPLERQAAIIDWKRMLDGVAQLDGSWRYGMLPDGSLAEENRRAEDGLSYNQGALGLKTVFAEILRRRGDSSLYTYTTPRGMRLQSGWNFLAAQVVSAQASQCTWPYTVDHCVDYSNRSGWEIAYAYWRTPAYLGPLALHRPYQWSNWSDPGYSTLLFGNLNINSK